MYPESKLEKCSFTSTFLSRKSSLKEEGKKKYRHQPCWGKNQYRSVFAVQSRTFYCVTSSGSCLLTICNQRFCVWLFTKFKKKYIYTVVTGRIGFTRVLFNLWQLLWFKSENFVAVYENNLFCWKIFSNTFFFKFLETFRSSLKMYFIFHSIVFLNND